MICSRANASHAELQVEIPTLFECIKYPVVAVGVVRWVEHTMLDPMFFEEATESSSLFLVLLDEVNFFFFVKGNSSRKTEWSFSCLNIILLF